MTLLVVKPPVMDESEQDSQLPQFLQVGEKITFEHDGQYHKGYHGRKDGAYRFSYKRDPRCKHEELGVTLPSA